MNLFAGVLTERDLRPRSEGFRFLETLARFERLRPRRFGTTEPLRGRFDPDEIGTAVADSWGKDFLWTSARAEGSANARLYSHELHSVVHIAAKDSEVVGEEVLRFTLKLAADYRADFAYVQCLGPEDLEVGRQNDTVQVLDVAGRHHNLYVASQQLRFAIPDLYWITVFGEPYVQLFGRHRIETTPVHSVNEVAENTFVLQLTPSMEDSYMKPTDFAATRAAAKGHLGRDAFYDERWGPAFADERRGAESPCRIPVAFITQDRPLPDLVE